MTGTNADLAALQKENGKLKRRLSRAERNHFARGLIQGIQSMLRPGDVVFDCGANVGEVTAPLAATGATVHAFEPDPYAFEKLSARMAGHDNVILHNAAVGVSSGSIHLMRSMDFEANPKAGSVKSTIISGGRDIDEAEDHGIEVDLIALPDVIRETVAAHGEVAFLKMDIEGAELDLLEYMMAAGLFETVRLTVAETHEKVFPDLRPRYAALRKAVADAYPITQVNLDWI